MNDLDARLADVSRGLAALAFAAESAEKQAAETAPNGAEWRRARMIRTAADRALGQFVVYK